MLTTIGEVWNQLRIKVWFSCTSTKNPDWLILSDSILEMNGGRVAGMAASWTGASAVDDSVVDDHEQITGSMLLDDW